MDKVRSNVHIPNVVGRLDPVVDAIRAEDWDEVRELVLEEQQRRIGKIMRMEEEIRKEEAHWNSLYSFWDNTCDPQLREQILREANQ